MAIKHTNKDNLLIKIKQLFNSVNYKQIPDF